MSAVVPTIIALCIDNGSLENRDRYLHGAIKIITIPKHYQRAPIY